MVPNVRSTGLPQLVILAVVCRRFAQSVSREYSHAALRHKQIHTKLQDNHSLASQQPCSGLPVWCLTSTGMGVAWVAVPVKPPTMSGAAALDGACCASCEPADCPVLAGCEGREPSYAPGAVDRGEGAQQTQCNMSALHKDSCAK